MHRRYRLYRERFALGRIAMTAGIDEHHILYSGDISHQQNRAFVNLLDIDLKPFESGAVQDRPNRSLLAFVDHAVPRANNRIPAETPIDIVIDHIRVKKLRHGSSIIVSRWARRRRF